MTTINTLQKALNTNEKAYKLLNWLEKSLQKQVISVSLATDLITKPRVAHQWLSEHYKSLPVETRPECTQQATEFINLFASFGCTSFTIKEYPGTRYVPHLLRNDSSSFTENNYIMPIRLSKKDKSTAKTHQLEVLRSTVKTLNTQQPTKLLDKEELVVPIAIYTYCELLIKRIHGHHMGSTHLVLWRKFAWTPEGSPKKNFKLTTQLYLSAKKQLEEASATIEAKS